MYQQAKSFIFGLDPTVIRTFDSSVEPLRYPTASALWTGHGTNPRFGRVDARELTR